MVKVNIYEEVTYTVEVDDGEVPAGLEGEDRLAWLEARATADYLEDPVKWPVDVTQRLAQVLEE